MPCTWSAEMPNSSSVSLMKGCDVFTRIFGCADLGPLDTRCPVLESHIRSGST